MARVNKTTNSYPRLFVGTCPPEPACSHFWLREHIHVLDEYKRPALPCFSLLIRSKYDAKILYAGSLRLESPCEFGRSVCQIQFFIAHMIQRDLFFIKRACIAQVSRRKALQSRQLFIQPLTDCIDGALSSETFSGIQRSDTIPRV